MSERIPSRTGRLLFLSALIWLLAMLVCLGLDRYGRGARRMGAVGTVGGSSLKAMQVNSPEDAYKLWKEKRFHGRTILYVADGWDRINPDELIQDDPTRSYPLTVYRTADLLEKNFLDARTFLYVASLQGIVRQVVAAVSTDSFRQAQELARRAKNARISADTVLMTYHGFPRSFTTLGSLSAPHEPVLLYVAASAFREHSPEDMLKQLQRAGVRTDAAVLCAQTGDASVTEGERNALARFALILERSGA